MLKRHHHAISTIDHKDQGPEYDDQSLAVERLCPAREDEANTVSSLLVDQDDDMILYAIRDNLMTDELEDEIMHAPVLDIDFPAALIPSSTPGHFHLYLERPITWGAYKRVLTTMADAGILEPGYVRASVARGRTFVRKPTCTKPPDRAPEPALLSICWCKHDRTQHAAGTGACTAHPEGRPCRCGKFDREEPF